MKKHLTKEDLSFFHLLPLAFTCFLLLRAGSIIIEVTCWFFFFTSLLQRLVIRGKRGEKKAPGGFISYHLFMTTTKWLRHVWQSVIAANRTTAPTKKQTGIKCIIKKKSKRGTLIHPRLQLRCAPSLIVWSITGRKVKEKILRQTTEKQSGKHPKVPRNIQK